MIYLKYEHIIYSEISMRGRHLSFNNKITISEIASYSLEEIKEKKRRQWVNEEEKRKKMVEVARGVKR